MKRFAIFAVLLTAVLLLANYFANYSQSIAAQDGVFPIDAVGSL